MVAKKVDYSQEFRPLHRDHWHMIKPLDNHIQKSYPHDSASTQTKMRCSSKKKAPIKLIKYQVSASVPQFHRDCWRTIKPLDDHIQKPYPNDPTSTQTKVRSLGERKAAIKLVRSQVSATVPPTHKQPLHPLPQTKKGRRKNPTK